MEGNKVGVTYSVQPHPVDVILILVFGELNAPFTAILIRIIFPSRDDTILKKCDVRVRI